MDRSQIGTAEGAAPDQPRPLGVKGRIASLDFIRGIAVMGILAANIVGFGQPHFAALWPDAFLVPRGRADDWLWLAQFVAIDGKMRGLFSLLFGAGMALFMDRAWDRGATRWLQARRLAWLLLFGLAHFFLLWRGDILTTYALCGFVVLPMLRWDAVRLLALGLTGYVFGSLYYAAAFGLTYLASLSPPGESAAFDTLVRQMDQYRIDELADGGVEAAIVQAGDYPGYVAHTVFEHGAEIPFMFYSALFETVPLMLIGMALYRMDLFAAGSDAVRVRGWGLAGLLVGAAMSLAIGLWTIATGFSFEATILAQSGLAPLARLPMILGLAALLAIAGNTVSGRLSRRVAAAGRMAFSNYLGTSLVMLFVFHGWALGLFGLLDRPRLYLAVAATWVAMLAWSPWWLTRFRYGPLEWLWRCLTYARMLPLRQ